MVLSGPYLGEQHRVVGHGGVSVPAPSIGEMHRLERQPQSPVTMTRVCPGASAVLPDTGMGRAISGRFGRSAAWTVQPTHRSS